MEEQRLVRIMLQNTVMATLTTMGKIIADGWNTMMSMMGETLFLKWIVLRWYLLESFAMPLSHDGELHVHGLTLYYALKKIYSD